MGNARLVERVGTERKRLALQRNKNRKRRLREDWSLPEKGELKTLCWEFAKN